MSLSVWQVDPVHLTPYYNLTLGAALAQVGCEVHYVTSNFIYDAALLYPADIQTHSNEKWNHIWHERKALPKKLY